MARPSSKAGSKTAYPGFIPPALAALQPTQPHGAAWLHELKLDGYRLQAHILPGDMRLLTRRGLDWTTRFGSSIPRDLRALAVKSAIFDGEVVHVGEDGLPSFPGLQEALAVGSKTRLLYYVFDLLYLDGRDLRPLPLIERKAVLAKVLATSRCVRYTEHFDDGATLFRLVCTAEAEGVVSKRRNSPYRSGRVKSWAKAVCVRRRALSSA
jgi:bifunctional non-homologous end joining protein LigD